MVTCHSCGRESPDGFAFCGACGAAFAPVAAAREVRKTVTVVFSDVTGSTALGIKGSKVGQVRLCLPPFSEQAAITTYLRLYDY